jgi:hypothetical protein
MCPKVIFAIKNGFIRLNYVVARRTLLSQKPLVHRLNYIQHYFVLHVFVI